LVPHLRKCKPEIGKKFDNKGNWLPEFIGGTEEDIGQGGRVGGDNDIRGFMDRIWRQSDDEYGNKLLNLWIHTNGIPLSMTEDKYFKLNKIL